MIKPDGSCELELPGIEDGWSPTWLPGGTALAFLGGDGIYVANLNELLGEDFEGKLCK